MADGYVRGFVRGFLRLDGLVLFTASILAFSATHRSWWLYLLLLFVPDIFMLGYLANTYLGAFLYNLGHSYLLPAMVVLIGWLGDSSMALAVGIIWLGHIGLDRFAGYGLKYHTSFEHTHLGELTSRSKRQQAGSVSLS